MKKHNGLLFSLLSVLLLLLPAGAVRAVAQAPIRLHTFPSQEPDSADVALRTKRHFWRASAEVVGFNLGLWAFDRYVQKGDFAYISWESIKNNFKHGFKWDNDKLGTNTFLHPYNGSLYYNAARSNGFNYWQSSLYAIAGSAMWEMFMECEYPSTNDIIATPIGGACIGEVLYRASDAMLDDRLTGGKRIEREAAAFILSPMRGLTRLVTGNMWKVRATPGRQFGYPNIALRISSGVAFLDCKGSTGGAKIGGKLQIDMEYGNRFEVRSNAPYDYFTLSAGLNIMKTQPLLNRLSIQGRLLAREFLKDRDQFLSVGLYQHFDFYDSDTISEKKGIPYKLGIPASIGGGVMYRDVDRHNWVFDAYLDVNAVILGSILSDHYRSDERNYNWASGFSIKGGVNFVLGRDRLSLSLHHQFYRLFTWSGYRYGTDLNKNPKMLNVQGDHSCASFNITDLRLDVKLYRHLYAALEGTIYHRNTIYRDYPDYSSTTYSLALLLALKF